MEFCFEILAPFMLVLLFIIFVVASVYLIWLIISMMKEKINKGKYDVLEEVEEIYDEYKVQRVIIVLGDETIEIEVDNYDIDDNIVEIKSIDGRVLITDTKNVLLMSE
ncbi:hypothetical protein [Clostridium cuniculi]|uniref:hypothetical protein n=1 Tax=Clostridium cuniculi TaxID=2548455 RepID=UPI001FA94280|nr:hypothetical protein [Clostridium cuniculi]